MTVRPKSEPRFLSGELLAFGGDGYLYSRSDLSFSTDSDLLETRGNVTVVAGQTHLKAIKKRLNA